jgi:DNA-binding ferritin-like protein
MLQDLLVLIKSMSGYYQTGHWQVKNSVFYSDHLLLERLYNETSARIDQIAEKMMGITGNAALLNLNELTKKQYEIVKALPYNPAENSVFFQTGLQCEQKLLELCKVIDSAPETSVGVRNMIGDIADESEARVYLLRQRLAKK